MSKDCSFKCGGKCCKDFVLPVSPIELEFDYKRFLKTGKNRWKEVEKIAPMVIYKGHYNVGAAGKGRNVKGKTHHYTCKHLNAETGLCMNYDDRPQMCREYPYGAACYYRGCTLDQTKEGVEVELQEKAT